MNNYLNQEISPATFKMMRKALSFSQNELAKEINVSVKTIQRMEISKNKIKGPIVSLLIIMFLNKDFYKKYHVKDKEYPIRFFYKYMDVVTSVIEVNNSNKNVRVVNLTNETYLLPFGMNENPTYDDYIELLKDRVFPENKDGVEFELRRLNIPFYDPYLIVLKTKGRVEGDLFSLEVDDND